MSKKCPGEKKYQIKMLVSFGPLKIKKKMSTS